MHGARSIVQTPCGPIAVGRRDGRLGADWRGAGADAPFCAEHDAEARALAEAIRASFAGNPAALAGIATGAGTDFQRRVWNACRAIPAGETRTYGWIAEQIGGGHAVCRAVGQALRRNPLPIVVPCHRVVASAGLGGYAGDRDGELAEIKRKLLRFESAAATVKC